MAGDVKINRRQYKFEPRKVAQMRKFNLTFKNIKYNILAPLNDLLEVRSHLYILLKNRLSNLRAKLNLTAAYFPSHFKINQKDSKNWEITTQICKDIQEEFNKYMTPVIFILIPTNFQVNEDVYDNYVNNFRLDKSEINLNQPQNILMNLFSKNELSLHNPLKFMRESFNNDSLLLYGELDTHLNGQGHKVMSEYLLSIISDKINIKYR